MQVVSLEMRDFRTYARAQARLGPGLTVVHGPNGAGKSNLLEALYFACTARSPRTRNERELIRFGAGATRVTAGLLDDDERHELSVGYAASGAGGRSEKRMSCDGASLERMLDAPTRPLVSVFMPDRLELIKGTPGLRRAHLDQFVVALRPARADARRQYSRVLVQRNALLARIRAGRASDATLASWDHELARWGCELSAQRAEAVAVLGEPFSQRAGELGCAGELELEYRPRIRGAGEDDFLAELSERRAGDVERGFTQHGPHRDELVVRRDDRELRVYGSQGEQRLALLALLLAERSVLSRERGRTPLMLLDDVMSELDGERRELLAGDLLAAGQSVVATTDLGHVPGGGDAAVTRLRISPGAIMQEAIAA